MHERRSRKWRKTLLAGGLVVLALVGLGLSPLGGALGHSASATASASATSGAVQGNAIPKCATGLNPEYVAYQPIKEWFYVTNPGSHTIGVYNKTCTLMSTLLLPTGADPRGIAFDPSNNHIYATDASLGKVYDIVGLKVVHKITSPTFFGPWGIAYAAGIGFYDGGGSMVVTNAFGANVSFLSAASAGATLSVFATWPVGSNPISVVWDPVYDEIAVVNQASNNLTIISTTTTISTVANVPVGSSPFEVAFSPASLLLYVTNVNSNNVTMVLASGFVWASVGVGASPYGVAYDPKTLDIYVTNFGSGNISVIGPAHTVVRTIALPAGSSPIGLAYNELTQKMDVVDWTTSHVYVVA